MPQVLKASHPRAHVPQDKPQQWETHAQQLEEQWRPSAAKNKQIFKNLIKKKSEKDQLAYIFLTEKKMTV